MGAMRLRLITLVMAAVAASGCAVALGPGVRVEKESLALRVDAAATSTRVEVQARLRVRNTGNRPLPHLTIALPAAARVLRANTEDGKASAMTETGRVTFSFTPQWALRAVQGLELDYELVLPAAPLAALPESWMLRVERPSGLLASGTERADRLHIEVSGPAGWVVALGGHLVQLPAGERSRKFDVGLRDPEPVLVVGPYFLERFRGRHLSVRLLTQKPLSSGAARQMAAEFEQSYELFRGLLGRLPSRLRALDVVEATPMGTGVAEEVARGSVVAVPAGTLEEALSAGRLEQQADELVARLWIGGALRTRPELRPLLEEGALQFLLLRAREVRLGSNLLEQAEAEARHKYRELEAAGGTSSQSRAEALRGLLYFLALDRRLGPQPVEQALGRLARLQDGRPVGFGELRAALELQTGRALGDIFKRWSTTRELPGD